jgi:hypothetical protein
MTGDIQLGKVLWSDGTTQIVTIFNTGSSRGITKKLNYIQKPRTKNNWSQPVAITAIDLKQNMEDIEIKGCLRPVDELVTSTLNGSHTAVITTITVGSTTGFDSTGYIVVDNEIIKYTGTNATQFTGCTRGQRGTTAAAYDSGTSVYQYDDDPEKLILIANDGGKIKMGNNNQTTLAAMAYNDNTTYYIHIEKLTITEPPQDGGLIFDVTISGKRVDNDLYEGVA